MDSVPAAHGAGEDRGNRQNPGYAARRDDRHQLAQRCRLVMTRALARKEDWGQLGPAMQALPNDQWRAFAEAYATKKPAHGMLVEAAREAGFGIGSTPTIMAKIAWRLANDDRMIAAIAELSRKIIRVGSTEAANAVLALLRDPKHKDHGRGLGMVLSRSDPIATLHTMEVVHRNSAPPQ